MSHVIIVFPPGAGGNHLKNLITGDISVANLYHSRPTVHSRSGENFSADALLTNKITHGHFGEIMSHQSLLRSINNKKFIILSPDTLEDRELLYKRRLRLGSELSTPAPGDYFDGEQVFLYESFMYYYYFNTTKNIT